MADRILRIWLFHKNPRAFPTWSAKVVWRMVVCIRFERDYGHNIDALWSELFITHLDHDHVNHASIKSMAVFATNPTVFSHPLTTAFSLTSGDCSVYSAPHGCPSGPSFALRKANSVNLPLVISDACASISSTSQLTLKKPPRRKSAAGVLSHRDTPPVRACVSFAKGVKASTTMPRSAASTMPGWSEKTRMWGYSGDR